MIQFKYTILYVQNVEKTLSFYQQAFDFSRRFIAPGGEYGELITGDTTLSFAAITLAKSNLSAGFIESSTDNKPFAMEIGITTDDVPATMDKAIAAGALLVEKSKQKPWGQTVAYVKDINGFLIEICTPVD
jgi:uncharacterized glyoxalase superfamily protein PhnB